MRFRRLFRGSGSTDYYLSEEDPQHVVGVRPMGFARIVPMQVADLRRVLLAASSKPLAEILDAKETKD